MSLVRQLIEASLKVATKADTPAPVEMDAVLFREPYSNRKLRAFFNARVYLPCGGCNRGLVRVRDESGSLTKARTRHAQCNGLGYRVNKRYGRCGKAGG
jgi:hypothetical protein